MIKIGDINLDFSLSVQKSKMDQDRFVVQVKIPITSIGDILLYQGVSDGLKIIKADDKDERVVTIKKDCDYLYLSETCSDLERDILSVYPIGLQDVIKVDIKDIFLKKVELTR